MELFYIILLVFFGLLFLVAELVLLPGVSVGALLALVSDGSAIYLAFRDFGATGGAVTIAVIVVLGLAATVLSLGGDRLVEHARRPLRTPEDR